METFELNFPLSRPHCGVPMGNGQLGVLVWGKDKICLTVNRSDYWDHRCGESYLGPHYKKLVDAYAPYDVKPINSQFIRQKMLFNEWHSTRLPCGRFELNLAENIKPQKAILDYSSGTVRIDCSNNESISFYQDLEQDVLLIEDGKDIIHGVKFISAWEYIGDIFERVAIPEPKKINTSSLCGEIQSLPEDPSLAVLYNKNEYGYAITLQRGKDNAEALKNAENIVKNEDFGSIKKRSSLWWNNYWRNTAEINIPDEFLNNFYKFALYKFACATHPHGIACGLQGPWVEEYQKTPWSGDYHFNVNIQQIYTLAFATGNFEHLLPLFDMLESKSFQKTMSDNARNMFGIDDGLLLTHAVNDHGIQCGGITAGSTLDFACGGWTAQLYWFYYKYTLDENFLKKRALPFIRGIMRVFEETLEECNGKLSIPLSISAEYGCTFKIKKDGRNISQNTGRNPSYQLSCMHMLTDILLEAFKITNQKPEDIWLDIKQHLPQYSLINQHFAIWEEQDLDVCHRHHSHLACIYPFDTLANPTAEQQEIINNSINHWILRGMGEWSEWCYPWAAIIQARMGFKDGPLTLLNLWKEIFINEGMATVYLPRFQGLSAHRHADIKKPRESNEIMQLDGTMAGATAILEMLVHQRGDTIYLFKGIPDKWMDVHLKNFRLPGAFIISVVRKNGKLESVKVKSIKGGALRIKLEDRKVQQINFKPNQEQELMSIPKKQI